MRSRSLLFVLPLFAAAVPAAAQDVVFVSGTGATVPVAAFGDARTKDVGSSVEMMKIASTMADPDMQDSVASAIERTTSTIMRMPVGRFAAAIEDARPGTVSKRIHRDTTIADLAGRDTRNLPEKLGDGSRDMMGLMGSFAQALAVMIPEFEAMGREIKGDFTAARAEAEHRR